MSELVTEKRLRNEIRDLKKNKLDFAQAFQDENDKFLFYFLLVGDVDDEDPKDKMHSGQYKNGYYLGKIVLPSNYPEKPGDFIFLTPSGRFKVGQKICLSNTGYHAETWSPIWSVRNMLLGLVSIFFSDKPEAQGANHLQMPKSERLKLANESIGFNIKNHRDIFVKFDQFVNEDCSIKPRNVVGDQNPEQKSEKKEPPKQVTKEIDVPIDNINQNEEAYMQEIMAQLKQKDEEEAKLKKEQEDQYMQQMIKQIEENERNELLQKIDKNLKENDVGDDIFIIDEPEEKPKKVVKSKNPVIKTVVKTTKSTGEKKNPMTKSTVEKNKPTEQQNVTIKTVPVNTKKNKNDLVNEKIEIIKKMTLKTYDYKVFKDMNNLIGLNLNEL